MADGTCSLPHCDTYGRLARGWCLTHYERWRQHGTTDDPTLPTPAERWWAKVNEDGPTPLARPDLGPCWVWTGWKEKLGYGRFDVGERPAENGKRRRTRALAYRWGYETFVGPVDSGLELDHLCRNPACVNFESHLEPVTHRENMLRGETLGARNAAKTHCLRGHEFSLENTKPLRGGGRECRACRRIHDQKPGRRERQNELRRNSRRAKRTAQMSAA